VAHSKQAALAFARIRLDSAYRVCVDRGLPTVLARQRIHLVETFTYELPPALSHCKKRCRQTKAANSSRAMQEEQGAYAYRAIRDVQSDLQNRG